MNRSVFFAALAALAFPASAKTYYVDARGGDDRNTGLGPSFAFRTIQRAVDQAAAGSTILVAPGSYAPFRTAKKLAVRSTDGAEATVVDGSLGDRSGDSEWLSPPTTKTEKRGGVACTVRSGEVRDPGACVLLGTMVREEAFVPTWNETDEGVKFVPGQASIEGFTLCRSERGVWGGSASHCIVERIDGNPLSFCSLTDSAVRDNTARSVFSSRGGAIATASTLNRCEIAGNRVELLSPSESGFSPVAFLGSGLCSSQYERKDGSFLLNCVVSGNEVSVPSSGGEEDGGFVSVDVYNCTAAGNVLDGAVCVRGNVYGSIVWGNRTSSGNPANLRESWDETTGRTVASDYQNCRDPGGNWRFTGDKAKKSMMDSCTETAVFQSGNRTGYYDSWGETVKYAARNSSGNISLDPRFLDPDAGDYRLAPWSPCIDAGANRLAKTGKTDRDGAPRKSGRQVDMGAFECGAAVPVPADYDGDGVQDPALFDPDTGRWSVWSSSDGFSSFRLGSSGAAPCPADYDGDGAAEPACFTAADKEPAFLRLRPDGMVETVSFPSCGAAAGKTVSTKGATPVSVKTSNGGGASFAVFTANSKTPVFAFPRSSAAIGGDGKTFPKGSKPVAADFTGDGKDDLGVYTANAAKPAFTILRSDRNFAAGAPFEIANPFRPVPLASVPLGPKGAMPCPADYDGDGKADFAVFSGNAGNPVFERLLSSSKWLERRSLPVGEKGMVPAAGDYDGDGSADIAVAEENRWLWVDSRFSCFDLVVERMEGGGRTDYAACDWTVVFEAGGGSGSMKPQGFVFGKAKPLKTLGFFRKGHVFLGWSRTAGGPVAFSDRQTVSDLADAGGRTIVLHAVWRPVRYTVAFDANGGAGFASPLACEYGKTVSLPGTGFARPGHSFRGWVRFPGGTEPMDGTAENLSDEDGATVTLYACWVPFSYVVRFRPNGGSGNMPDQRILCGSSTPLSANAFKRTGHVFLGWSAGPDAVRPDHADGERVLDLCPSDGGTVDLFAVWSPIRYTVAFNANGGSGSMAALSVAYGETTELPRCGFRKTGRDFAGWARTAKGAAVYGNGETAVLDLTEKNGATVTLYAVWVEVGSRRDWFVDADRGRAGAAGTEDDPLDSIQEALDRAVDGNRIFVQPGFYDPIETKKAVTVIGVCGRDKTFIDGGRYRRCATLGDKTRLEGFTLQYGFAAETAGVEGGFLADSVIRNCYADDLIGAAKNATLEDCLICENRAWNTVGGVSGCTLRRSVLRNNGSRWNGGQMFGSFAENCLIEGMDAYFDGFRYSSGLAYSDFSNCTVFEKRTHDAVFHNCIADVPKPTWSTDVAEMKYTCVPWNPASYPIPDCGPGNIYLGRSVKNLFVDPDNGDYRLRPDAAAVDAGSNGLVPADPSTGSRFDAVDLDGNDRIRNGTVDMGCYERQDD